METQEFGLVIMICVIWICVSIYICVDAFLDAWYRIDVRRANYDVYKETENGTNDDK